MFTIARAYEKIYHRLVCDKRLTVCHMSFCSALIYLWYCNQYRNPVPITRKKLMELAHINSIATYHKCIKELTAYGYIRYLPSYNYYLGSFIYLNDLSAND